MTIRITSEGWRHQYRRMKRSRDWFNAPHQIVDEYDVASLSSQEVSVRSSYSVPLQQILERLKNRIRHWPKSTAIWHSMG